MIKNPPNIFFKFEIMPLGEQGKWR